MIFFNSAKYGAKTIMSLGPYIWKTCLMTPNELAFLSVLKSKIEYWKIDEYPCRLCTTYIQYVGIFDGALLRHNFLKY